MPPPDRIYRRSRSSEARLSESEDLKTKNEVEEEEEEGVQIAPDGGYGWVIVGACALISFTIDGMFSVFGTLLPVFIEEFDSGRGQTSVVGSVLTASLLISGPFISVLANCIGCRLVCMMGGCLLSAGLLLSSLSPNIEILTLTFGFMSGFGLGMIYLPSIVMVGYYFERKRAFATGISTAGSGIGMLAMAPITALLLKNNPWTSTLFYIACVTMQTVICGVLLKPLDHEDMEEIPEEMEDSEAEPLPVARSESDPTPHRKQSILPTAPLREIVEEPEIDEENVQDEEEISASVSRDETSSQITEYTKQPPAPSSKASLKADAVSMKTVKSDRPVYKKSPDSSKLDMKTFYSCMEFEGMEEAEPMKPFNVHKMSRQISITSVKSKKDLAKPLFRHDILYTSSVVNLPEYRVRRFSSTSTTYLGTLVNMVHEPAVQHIVEEQKVCHCIPKHFLVTFKQMLDFSMLKNPTFILIVLSNICLQTGCMIPSMFMVDYGISLGIDRQLSSFLVSIFGICNTVGRIVGGGVAIIPKINSLLITALSIIMAGVSTFFTVMFCQNYIAVAIGVAFIGLFMAPPVPLTPVFLVKYLGLNNLTNAFGLLNLFKGVTCLVGVPFAGWLKDNTGDFVWPFTVAAILLVISGAIHFLFPISENFRLRSEAKKARKLSMARPKPQFFLDRRQSDAPSELTL